MNYMLSYVGSFTFLIIYYIINSCLCFSILETGYLGVIVLGDSVSAHFRLPPQWITASMLNKEVFKNFEFIVANELDWPQLSLYTAYLNESR